MNKSKLDLLQDELNNFRKAAEILSHSYKICRPIIKKTDFSLEELDKLEALTSRFARFSDLFIQKILRLIELIEL